MDGEDDNLDSSNGYPKTLPEDTVDYSIYVLDSSLKSSDKRALLAKCRQDIISHSKELLKGYIWQRQPFGLELVYDESLSSWTLRGNTNFGDSVDDEWLIVYMLMEASKRHSNVWIRIYDNDGEFLLIEAANALPEWLKPEIAENRVWIHTGQVKIIPIDAQTSFTTRSPLLKEACEYIEKSSSLLTHLPNLEKEALYRIQKYPTAIPDHFHESFVLIPRKLAYILHSCPAYISPTIESFYTRDLTSLKILLNSNSTTVVFPPQDLVTTSLRFTKVGFAQIKSQEFPVTPLWSSCTEGLRSEQRSRALLGMKLTVGFELLLSDPLCTNSRAVREIKLLLEDLEEDGDLLPTDENMKQWSQKNDNEDWMKIDFSDFERVLDGKGKTTDMVGEGFGDKMAQENLQKMVSRFQDFMNDEDAGLEGADLDSECSEDDEDDDVDSDDQEARRDEAEDEGEIVFDEAKFAQLLRQMAGFQKIEDPDEFDGEGMEQAMKSIEQELKDAGVIEPGSSTQGKESKAHKTSPHDEAQANTDINADFDLVKNMLESFKSQGGFSGPAGNLMGLMGVSLPADDEDVPKEVEDS